MAEVVEGQFMNDFQIMYSKNNNRRPKAEREYFDRPVDYIPQGYTFSPVHKRPIELTGEFRASLASRGSRGTSQSVNKSPQLGGNKSVHSFMSNTMYSTGKGPGKSNAFIPITNGMNDDQLF